MRFVKMFLMFLLVGSIVSLSTILMVYEGRLWWVGYKLQDDFLEVKRLSNQEVNRYRKDCYESDQMVFDNNNTLPKPSVKGFGLRFTSDSSYVIEAVCQSVSRGPITIKQGRLGFGIRKLQGSGLLYPVGEEGEISALVLIGDKFVAREVGLIKNELVSRLVDANTWDMVDNNAPDTVCQGWGKVCCDPATQVGSGNGEERVLDCRGQCFASCQNRPVLVYFNSDPALNMADRKLEVSGDKVEVVFGFEIIDQDSPIGRVTVDFGDGESYTAKNNQEIIRHFYYCPQDTCHFKALIEAVDSTGLTLMQPRLQVINVTQRGGIDL